MCADTREPLERFSLAYKTAEAVAEGSRVCITFWSEVLIRERQRSNNRRFIQSTRRIDYIGAIAAALSNC